MSHERDCDHDFTRLFRVVGKNTMTKNIMGKGQQNFIIYGSKILRISDFSI